jgi:aminopeptidase-like protein
MEPIDYSRGRNNANSKLAFTKVKETIPKMWERVYELVDGKNSTLDIATILRVQIHKISGRFSELKAKQP